MPTWVTRLVCSANNRSRKFHNTEAVKGPEQSRCSLDMVRGSQHNLLGSGKGEFEPIAHCCDFNSRVLPSCSCWCL
jgi:hypothetical protein